MTLDTLKTVLVAAVVALVITVGALTLVLHNEGHVAGATLNPTAEPTGLTNLAVSGLFCQGGSNLCSSTNITTDVVTGSCNTASSTAFAVLNPYNASTTASVEILTAAQATSSLMQIGTSTTATGLTSSTVSSGLLTATIATGSVPSFYSSGITTSIPVTVTNYSVVVGPNQYVGDFSTSTYGGGGAVGYTPTSCTYLVTFKG